jgi:hypothetical protein
MAPEPELPLPLRLHLGCGDKRIDGWVNIDGHPLPGVDMVADLRRGLDFANVETVFAEHFLEHLTITEALDLLVEIHRVLVPGGWLRLSTPSLDWAYVTCYRLEAEPEVRREAALALNRAFYAWGHRFLWNEPLLREALAACGFVDVRACRYGESSRPELCGLERHEPYPDTAGLQHVLILEARKGPPDSERLAALRAGIARSFLDHLDDYVLPPDERWREIHTALQRRAQRLQAELEAEHRRRTAAERDWVAARDTLRRVERSPSFRLGRALSAPARALRRLLRGGVAGS